MVTRSDNSKGSTPAGLMSVVEFDKMWMSDEKEPSSSSPKGCKKQSVTKTHRSGKSWKRGTRPEGMPRRPLSAYNLFFKDQREVIITDRTLEERARSGNKKLKRAKIAFEELARTIGAKWKSIDPLELERYKALAEQDSKRYKTEMDAYATKSDIETELKQRSDSPVVVKAGVAAVVVPPASTNITSLEQARSSFSDSFATAFRPEETTVAPNFFQGFSPENPSSDIYFTSALDTQGIQEWTPLRPNTPQEMFRPVEAGSDRNAALVSKDNQYQHCMPHQYQHCMLHQYDADCPLPFINTSTLSPNLVECSLVRLLAGADANNHQQQPSMNDDMLSVSSSWMEPTPIREFW